MFPDQGSISGKRLIPQLAVGCIVFTLIGLIGTYLLAGAISGYLKNHPSAAQPTRVGR